MSKTPVARALELLGAFAGSAWAERLGLREPAEALLYQGVRRTVRAGSRVGARFEKLKELLPGQGLARVQASPTRRFDLTPTEEQQMIGDMLRRFAGEVMRPRASAADVEGAPGQAFSRQVHELGLNLFAIPEALDGAGVTRSPITSALIAEGLAYGDMDLAVAAVSPLGVINLLGELGSREQQARYLPAFGGEAPTAAALALMEPRARFHPGRLKTRATWDGRRFRLHGLKCMVPLASHAELLVVFAQLDDEGPRAFLVERGAPGLEITAEPTMGLRGAGLGQVRLRDVHVGREAALGEGEVSYDHERVVDLCRVGSCALAVGTCQAVVDYVIPYCNEREAFGEPISHRQAVAFAIADMATELEGMRLMTWRAASRAEQGLSLRREAYLARVLCAERAMQIGSDGVQLLGGHGYTREHPVERWFRQLRAVGVLEGTFAV